MRTVKEISFENKDIIIVDPCYFTDSDDDRESSKYGRDLSRLHINGIGTPTVWGDIAAYVISTDGHVLGTVTADSGIICVADGVVAVLVQPVVAKATTNGSFNVFH